MLLFLGLAWLLRCGGQEAKKQEARKQEVGASQCSDDAGLECGPKIGPLPGPLHGLSPGTPAGAVVALYGAIGPHNFGDLLMPAVLAELLKRECGYSEEQVVFADVVGQDMRIFGGEDVVSIVELRELTTKVDVIAVGGEVLSCGLYGAVNMILGGDDEEEHLVDWPPATRAAWHKALRSDLYAPLRAAVSVYIPQKSWFRNPGAMTASAIGGSSMRSESALRGLDFASSRDDLRNGSVLAPCCVILVRELFEDRIAAFAEASVGRKRYAAVQFGPLQKDEAELLALQLARIAKEQDLDLVLFVAGTARGHGSFKGLAQVARLVAHHCPMARVQVFRDLSCWSAAAVISRAELVLSTSLHVRIVAFAYARPRLAIRASKKYRRFVELWDWRLPSYALHNADEQAVLAEGLADLANLALGDPHFTDAEPAKQAAAHYLRNVFHPVASLLSRDCVPRSSKLLDRVPDLTLASVLSRPYDDEPEYIPESYALGPGRESTLEEDHLPPRTGPGGSLAALLQRGETPCAVLMYGGSEYLFGMTRRQCLDAHGIDVATSEVRATLWAETNEQATFGAYEHLLPGGGES